MPPPHGKPSRRMCPWHMISLLVCGLLCLLTMVGSITAWYLSYSPADRYLVLLDAGSVHTSDPLGASRFISSHSCVLSSISGIPPASRPLSSVLFGSTARMRVLNLTIPDTAQQILGNLTKELGLVSLGMKSVARILDGEEEGVDGWVTVNYLNGGLGEKEQMGALDWGEASSHITRVVGEGSEANMNLALKRHRAGLVYSLFKKHDLVEENNPTGISVPDPCLPKGSSTNPISLGQLYRQQQDHHLNLPTEPDHLLISCAKPQPGETTCLDPDMFPHPGDVKYLAFSTYWYLTHFLGLASRFPLEDFKKLTSNLCSANKTSPILLPFFSLADMACFQATFMTHLLTKAYHFNSTTWPQISFVKRIADAEVGWGLGHAIAQANRVAPPEGRQYISLHVLVVLLSISGLLFRICVATALGKTSVDTNLSLINLCGVYKHV